MLTAGPASVASFFLLQSATGTVGALDPFFGAGKYIFQIFSKVRLSMSYCYFLGCELTSSPSYFLSCICEHLASPISTICRSSFAAHPDRSLDLRIALSFPLASLSS